MSGRGRELADLPRRFRDYGVQPEADLVTALAVALRLHVAHRHRGHATPETVAEGVADAGDEGDGDGQDDRTGFVGHDGVLPIAQWVLL